MDDGFGGGGCDSGSGYSSGVDSCFSPSSSTPSSTIDTGSSHGVGNSERVPCSPDSDLFNGENIDYLTDTGEALRAMHLPKETSKPMAINFEDLNTGGAHAQSLNFSKAVEVQTGQLLNFSKDNPGVSNLRVELYWASEHDGDVSVVIADANGKALQGMLPAHMQDATQKAKNKLYQPTRGLIWYNNLAVPGATHSGDALTSNGDESLPEETVKISLDKLESTAEEVVIVASTHSKTAQSIPFAELKQCRVLVINDDTNEVIYVYSMSRQFRDFSSVELANFFKSGTEWEFASMGSGVGNSPEALGDIAKKYGL